MPLDLPFVLVQLLAQVEVALRKARDTLPAPRPFWCTSYNWHRLKPKQIVSQTADNRMHHPCHRRDERKEIKVPLDLVSRRVLVSFASHAPDHRIKHQRVTMKSGARALLPTASSIPWASKSCLVSQSSQAACRVTETLPMGADITYVRLARGGVNSSQSSNNSGGTMTPSGSLTGRPLAGAQAKRLEATANLS